VVALAARLAQLGAGLAPASTTPRDSPGDRLLTMPEAAERLGITEHHAREMGRRGELPVTVIGERFVRVHAGALEEWIRRREGATVAPSRRR
jgi:excisionase family DNA binding protein